MDPYWNTQAYRILAEALAERELQDQAHHPEWSKHLLHGMGGLLVALGQKIQAGSLDVQTSFEATGYASFDDEVCA